MVNVGRFYFISFSLFLSLLRDFILIISFSFGRFYFILSFRGFFFLFIF